MLTVTNSLLFALGAWILKGRNLNPHQSFEDRSRQIRASLNSFLYVSMAMSAFVMLQAIDDVYDLDHLDATLTSVYFQAIVYLSLGHLLRRMRLEDMNFDVYKAVLD